MTHDQILTRRIRLLTWLFILALVLSGVSAIPILAELDWLLNVLGAEAAGGPSSSSPWMAWLFQVRAGLEATGNQYPFLFYGTDWLAFGHFVIALAFLGALRDPVRNRWLYSFAMIACALVIPYALVFGGIRGIPLWWRLLDCLFGVCGFFPPWLCRKWSRELELLALTRQRP